MNVVLDYGSVATARTNDDGSISFYGRVAVANRPYRYVNRDGSIRVETISRDELFKPDSVNTLKLQAITNGHSNGVVTPENYRNVVAGSTGHLAMVGADGDYLGINGVLRAKDAIDAYNSGVRQLSPGYVRRLIATDRADSFIQSDRTYHELALVDRARGGIDVRIKDGFDDTDWMFDSTQIDEDLSKSWANLDGLDRNAIDRLLRFGTVNPTPITIPTKMKLKLGKDTINVDEADVQVVTDANAQLATIDNLKKDKADLEAQLKIASDSLAKAKEALGNKDSIVKTAIAETLAQVSQLGKDAELLKNCGIEVSADSLANNDPIGFKTAVVTAVYGKDSIKDAADTELRYESTIAAYTKIAGNKDAMPNFTFESNMSKTAQTVANLNGNGEASIMAGNTGYTNGLPADDTQHGWY